MAKEDNLVEVVASHHFMCRGASRLGTLILKKEDAVPVIVNIHKDGNADVYCTQYQMSKCEAPVDERDYVKCPFVHSA